MLSSELRGVVTALVTPFLPDESVDFDSLAAYARYVAAVEGVRGVLVCGYTGEITSLTRAEQLQVTERVVAVCGGELPVVVGIQPTSARDTIAFGRELKAAGADVLQMNSPFYNLLRRGHLQNGDAVVDFFRRVGEGIELPFTIFQYPASSGLSYPSATLARLAELEHVIGIKAAVEMETYEADAEAVRGKAALFADNNSYTLISMLLHGADGSMVGIGNVGTHLWTELYRLTSTGSVAEAVELANQRLVPLMRTFSRDLGTTPWSFVGRVKEALVRLGLIEHATVRSPEPALTAADRTAVADALEAAGLLAGSP